METALVRSKNILPNKHHNQQKEIVNKNYLRVTRGDEPEVVKAKLKDPNYKAPPDVNISQPKYVPQVRLGEGLVGLSKKLENLLAGQNKNPYTLTKQWNKGYPDNINPNLFLGREYTLQLMRDAGVEPYELEETEAPVVPTTVEPENDFMVSDNDFLVEYRRGEGVYSTEGELIYDLTPDSPRYGTPLITPRSVSSSGTISSSSDFIL